MFSFLGSDPPKVFLLFYQYIHYQFSECVMDFKYFSTSDKAQFLQFLILSFIILVYRQPWKLLTNLFGCCSRTVSVLLLSVLLSIFAPLLPISLAWIKTILDVSGAPQKVIIIAILCTIISSQPANNITSRCK